MEEVNELRQVICDYYARKVDEEVDSLWAEGKWDNEKTRLHILLDRNQSDFGDLSKRRTFVHTSLRRILDFSWNLYRIAVSLHHQKSTEDKVKMFTTNADARSSQNTQDTNTEVQETIMGIRV